MNVSVTDFYHAAGSSDELVKVIFIKIRSESYEMNMVAVPNWNCLSGNSCETMVMRIFFSLSNFYAALNFMNMALRVRAGRTALIHIAVIRIMIVRITTVRIRIL